MKSNSSTQIRSALNHALPQEIKKTDMVMPIMACFITMLAVSTVFMTQPIFMEIAETYRISTVDARFSFTMASFSYAVAFFIIGPAIDLFNLSRMALIGLILLACVIFCSSYITNFTGFVTAMGGVGFFAALIPSTMFPYMSHIAPDERKEIYIGAVVASATTGVIAGRVLVGGVTGLLGWQSAFRLIALMLFIVAILSILTLGNQKKSCLENRNFLNHYKETLIILKSKDILMLYGTGFLIFFGFIGMITFLTYRLSAQPFNFTPEKIGWISFAGITALIAPFSGELSKRFGIFQIILPGLLICTIALQLTGWFTSVFPVILGLLLLFLGVYSCQPLIFLLVASHIPVSKIGFASSFYILSCIGGGSVSTIILGPVWKLYGWEGITVVCSLSIGVAFAMILWMAFKKR